MENASLDDFMALNDEITALIGAGVPSGLDLGVHGDHAAATLEKVNAAVARRVSRGESLADALGNEPTAPAAYRSVMQAGWRSGNVQQALDASTRLAVAAEESRVQTRAAYFYPLVVCGLATVGIAGFCLYLAPALARFFEEFRLPESSVLRMLPWLQGAMPYLIGIGLVLIAAISLVRLTRGQDAARGGQELLGRFAGASPRNFHQRCASFCDQLVALLDAGTPLQEGIRLAADACGDRTLEEGARAYLLATEQRAGALDDGPATRLFPPFLRWALWHADESIGRTQSLRLAADVYRESAERRAERARIATPFLACVLLGGGATLLYGLMLFLPVTEMLKALAY